MKNSFSGREAARKDGVRLMRLRFCFLSRVSDWKDDITIEIVCLIANRMVCCNKKAVKCDLSLHVNRS